jgi:hypothetical protein
MTKNHFIFELLVLLGIAFLFNGNTSFANERTPLCKSLTVSPEANEVILTVPENEQFVLLKLYADCSTNQNWHLDIDSEVLLAGTISSFIIQMYQQGVSIQKTYVHDFPDSCVVVPAGKTLTAVNKNAMGYTLKLTLIGYLRKIDTGLVSDLNSDHKIDFADFAILFNEWLATSP